MENAIENQQMPFYFTRTHVCNVNMVELKGTSCFMEIDGRIDLDYSCRWLQNRCVCICTSTHCLCLEIGAELYGNILLGSKELIGNNLGTVFTFLICQALMDLGHERNKTQF